MAYTHTFDISIGTSNAASLSGGTIRAQLVGTDGTSVGSAISTGFVDLGLGLGLWHYASIPDSHRGGVKFYDVSDASDVFAFVAINPEGVAENTDAKTSTVGGGSLTEAGIAAAVWAYLSSSATTVGSLGKRIVDYLTGDIFARLGAPAGASHAADVAAAQTSLNTITNSRLTSTRAGYLDNLATAPPTAAQNATAVWDKATSAHTTTGTTGKALTDILAASAATGSGDTAVDHDTGGDDTLRITIGGNGVSGATITAYLTSEVTASGYSGATKRGTTKTGSDGRWLAPLMLDAGTYTLVITTADGDTLSTTASVTVA